MVITNKKVKLDTSLIGEIQKIGEKHYLILEDVKCERCNRTFFKQISYDGSVQEYRLCPLCHSEYWKIPRIRNIYKSRIDTRTGKMIVPKIKVTNVKATRGSGGKKS